jgi:tripartite-type tricarboxylate transporter receptor subunit TctC
MKKIAFLAMVCLLSVPYSMVTAQVSNRTPLKIVIPYSPGGSTDSLARILQKSLSDTLGQPVLIENKPGASGTIGTEYVAKAPPDGNTIVLGNQGPNALVPAYRKTPYDPLNDLRPLTTIAYMPMLLVTSTKAGPKTLKELMFQARESGANVRYGSSGNGSIAHLTGYDFARQAKLQMTHIPYQGGGQVVTGLLRGDVLVSFMPGTDIATLADQARILAVGAPRRISSLPDVPAVAEEIPGFQSVLWLALFAPKGTSDEIADRLKKAINRAVEQPDFQKYVMDRYGKAATSTPEELTQLIKQDMQVWGAVAREANAQK